VAQLYRARPQTLKHQDDRQQQQGFALVSLIVLLPLALALIGAVTFTYAILTRKSAAQSLCVREVTRMQSELGHTLAQLLRLNPRATQLRAQRERADLNLENALATGYPPAIAIAQAYQIAVIVAQLQLREQQQALLVEAQETRLRHKRLLESQISSVGGGEFHSQAYYFRALAVREEPLLSLTPDYVTVAPFEFLQQHRFRYAVTFQPQTIKQTTECSASLQSEGNQWNAKILAASALSKRRL
jgi:hypothetical protein